MLDTLNHVYIWQVSPQHSLVTLTLGSQETPLNVIMHYNKLLQKITRDEFVTNKIKSRICGSFDRFSELLTRG